MHLQRTSFAAVLSLFAFSACFQGAQAQSADILTWHNDSARTGLDSAEKILTPANVKSSSFGKVAFLHTDGKVDAEPLYAAGIKINGVVHNVVYVATEHASVYAFDADNGVQLWKVSVLLRGQVTSGDRACNQITPEIGITATPVIDFSHGPHGAIYVVNMSKDSAGKYYQHLSALDLVTGFQLFGGPAEITASYPGTGDDSKDGQVVFDPGQYAERAALVRFNGAIFTAWTSHCDVRPYTGWIMGFNPANLERLYLYNTTPNGSEGAVWMSGAGLAANATNMYLLDANGTFDTTLDGNGFPINGDFGNSFISLAINQGRLGVADYYATDTTVQQSNNDVDLGSGGAMLLPTLLDNNGNQHHLAVGAGKDSNIYLVNLQNMGKYHPNGGTLYDAIPGALPSGEWSAPAYFNNKVYYGGVQDNLKAFAIADAKLINTPASKSPETFGYPGATPSISANGTSNGILWAVENVNPAVLHAYNAENLGDELYNSNQAGSRDHFGSGNKFITPAIANGRVYVGTQSGVAIFGLLHP